MPFAALKPCKGCRKPVSGAYCDGCRQKGAAKERRPTAAQRGYGYQWQQASKGWLKKHPLCVDPYKDHEEQVILATEVDHKIPHKGNMVLFWDRNNWQSLCHTCHSRKTATEDGGFGRF